MQEKKKKLTSQQITTIVRFLVYNLSLTNVINAQSKLYSNTTKASIRTQSSCNLNQRKCLGKLEFSRPLQGDESHIPVGPWEQTCSATIIGTVACQVSGETLMSVASKCYVHTQTCTTGTITINSFNVAFGFNQRSFSYS